MKKKRAATNAAPNMKDLLPALSASEGAGAPPAMPMEEWSWTASTDNELLDSEVVLESELAVDSSKSFKRRKVEEREREEEIRSIEADTDVVKRPKTPDDFEILLRTSSNSSFVWIQYVAFWLSRADIERARTTVKRSLEEIYYREEKEKLNVWIAWLNLESTYGTDESLTDVFKEALRRNPIKPVYRAMAKIHEQKGNLEAATNTWKRLSKTCPRSQPVFCDVMTFYMRNSMRDDAVEIMQRALQRLPKRKHIAIISKLARLEFEHGSMERGRTIYDSLVTNHPKRVDIWVWWVDQEIKHGEIESARRVFQRVVTLNLSTKKMRFLFKKYLAFESKHGDDETVAEVRERVKEYLKGQE